MSLSETMAPGRFENCDELCSSSVCECLRVYERDNRETELIPLGLA